MRRATKPHWFGALQQIVRAVENRSWTGVSRIQKIWAADVGLRMGAIASAMLQLRGRSECTIADTVTLANAGAFERCPRLVKLSI